MTGVLFDNPDRLYLAWVALAIALLGVGGIVLRRHSLRRFVDATLWPRLLPGASIGRRITRIALVACSLALLAMALAGPRWGRSQQPVFRRNIDVVVLLDVSQSMLARDIAPSRLERAKLALRQDLLPALAGEHIGLITFAGDAAVACPLTADYGAFRLALDDVTIHSAERGGTLIGDAIRAAGTLFPKNLDTHRLIILITDGEDQESFPLEAAAAAWTDQRAAIITVALGDPQQGAPIPVTTPAGEELLTHDGQTVRSHADFATLRRIAAASDVGVFVPAGTGDFDLGGVYRDVTRHIRVAEDTQQKRTQQPGRAHWFALAALLLVLIDSGLPDARRRAATSVKEQREAA